MTELVKIMQQRHSCREFLDKAVENEKIVACINAASLAPSACNTQPYHFYVANTPETVAAAAEYCKADHVNKWVHDAKAFVIVTQEHANMPTTLGEAVRKDFRHFDIGLALENFLLEATELGLGTCILGSFNEEKLKSYSQPEENRSGNRHGLFRRKGSCAEKAPPFGGIHHLSQMILRKRKGFSFPLF